MLKVIKRVVMPVIALLLVGAMLCGCAKTGAFDVNKKIVCEVDGKPITYDEYKYFFYSHHTDVFGAEAGVQDAEAFERIKALTEDSLRRKATIMRFIDEYDVKLTKEDKAYADEVCEAQLEIYGSEAEYMKFLLDGRATGNVFRDQVMLTFKYDPALRELFKTGINKDINVSDAAIQASVTGGDFYAYQYAFFELKAGTNSIELEKEANEFYTGLINGKKTFTKEDCDAIGQRPLGFEEAILKLKEGETSKVLWGADWSNNAGYYVFKRVAVDWTKVVENFEKFEIENEYFASKYLEYIRQESKEIKIEYAKYFESLDYATFIKREELT